MGPTFVALRHLASCFAQSSYASSNTDGSSDHRSHRDASCKLTSVHLTHVLAGANQTAACAALPQVFYGGQSSRPRFELSLDAAMLHIAHWTGYYSAERKSQGVFIAPACAMDGRMPEDPRMWPLPKP
ncbi:hypothetical protein GY45DRAFT_1321786 [Cubamyces sp. BRFM 1775]|nr:hypothetical protein GY45DRAFT_1321786 [Cubamyces sp. BRFM 1775]